MEELKRIMSTEDYNLLMSYIEKGKHLGEIINNPKCSKSYKADATKGGIKLNRQKKKLLEKYHIAIA